MRRDGNYFRRFRHRQNCPRQSARRANLAGVLLTPTTFIPPQILKRCAVVIRSPMKIDGRGWTVCANKSSGGFSAGENAVFACSALRRAYRDRLRISDEVRFVFLRGNYALVERQLRRRRGHFMNAALLQSQFDDLEEPQPDENVLTIELGRKRQEIIRRNQNEPAFGWQRLARCDRFGTARLGDWCQ